MWPFSKEETKEFKKQPKMEVEYVKCPYCDFEIRGEIESGDKEEGISYTVTSKERLLVFYDDEWSTTIHACPKCKKMLGCSYNY